MTEGCKLFSPLKMRELEIKNRIMMPPMCQYSAHDGVANEWHLTHYGTRSVGGVGLIIVEATGILPEGRISNQCLGLYNIEQMNAFKPITKIIKSFGAVPAIQLNHAGRKCEIETVIFAPSAIAFSDKYKIPKELTSFEIEKLINDFKLSAEKALSAGFEVIELHMAHGYLLHQFLSPLSNKRTDEYGGTLEKRMKFPLLVAKEIRKIWPSTLPIFVRLSATDWVDGGLDIKDTLIFCQELKKIGIDFIDVSTGGNVADAKIPVGPHYQVKFANEIKREVGILTGAVGMITDAKEALKLLNNNEADAVLLGRELLRNPYWAYKASIELNIKGVIPTQYQRAF